MADEADYYLKRYEAERAAADAALDPNVKEIHRSMAAAYASLAEPSSVGLRSARKS